MMGDLIHSLLQVTGLSVAQSRLLMKSAKSLFDVHTVAVYLTVQAGAVVL